MDVKVQYAEPYQGGQRGRWYHGPCPAHWRVAVDFGNSQVLTALLRTKPTERQLRRIVKGAKMERHAILRELAEEGVDPSSIAGCLC